MKLKMNLFMILIMIILVLTSCMNSSNADFGEFFTAPDDVEVEYVPYGEYEVIANRILIGYETTEHLNTIVEKLNAEIMLNIKKIKVAVLHIQDNVEETIKSLSEKKIDGIRFVEPSYKREAILPDVEDEFLPPISRSTNDPYYQFLWGLRKIKTEEAWNMGYTGKNVVIAICDSGSDASHPDLSGQYVDGRLINSSTDVSIPAGSSIPYGSHGTHVSGTIAAVKDNNIGVVGVAPDSKLMPIPIFSYSFAGDAYVAAGWVWAVDNGAKILQNSWGGPGYSYTLKAAIDYAIENGAVVVVSTGNNHINENWGFPNSAPGVIGVGASTVNDIVSGFSTRGDSVSVVAPGEEILSTISMNSNGATIQDGEHYAYKNGTSMASPHVSGLAALLYEKFPSATPYQIRQLIEIGAESSIQNYGENSSRGLTYNENSGYGRIDSVSSLQLPLPVGGTGGNLTINVTDESGLFNIRGMNVTLKRTGRPSYRAKTDFNGVCKFRAIDPGNYDIYIGGPDFGENDSLVNRIEEELTSQYQDFAVDESSVLVVELSSTFSAELTMPSHNSQYIARLIDTLGTVIQTETAINDEVVNFTKPDSNLDFRYYISVEASPSLAKSPPIMTEDFERQNFQNPDWSWNLSGDTPPTITNTESSSGTYAMQFGDITNYGTSALTGTFNVPLGTSYWFSFDVKVSSEDDWDFVYVWLDDELIYTGSGELDWETITREINSGTHTIVFQYDKDGSVSEGDDTGWIDNIQINAIPLNLSEYDVTGTVMLNGHTISVAQNLYLGRYVDEFTEKDVPWVLF